MLAILCPAAPIVNPSPAPFTAREAWWAGFSAGLDGKPAAVPFGYPDDLTAAFLAGHWSGDDNRATDLLSAAAEARAVEELDELAVEPSDHTAADEREYLGWTLGADGVDAEPAGLLTAADRAGFAFGHHAGEDHLYTVDPLWAEHLRDRALKSATFPGDAALFAAYDDDLRHQLACGDHFRAMERDNDAEFYRRRVVVACPSMVD